MTVRKYKASFVHHEFFLKIIAVESALTSKTIQKQFTLKYEVCLPVDHLKWENKCCSSQLSFSRNRLQFSQFYSSTGSKVMYSRRTFALWARLHATQNAECSRMCVCVSSVSLRAISSRNEGFYETNRESDGSGKTLISVQFVHLFPLLPVPSLV